MSWLRGAAAPARWSITPGGPGTWNLEVEDGRGRGWRFEKLTPPAVLEQVEQFVFLPAAAAVASILRQEDDRALAALAAELELLTATGDWTSSWGSQVAEVAARWSGGGETTCLAGLEGLAEAIAHGMRAGVPAGVWHQLAAAREGVRCEPAVRVCVDDPDALRRELARLGLRNDFLFSIAWDDPEGADLLMRVETTDPARGYQLWQALGEGEVEPLCVLPVPTELVIVAPGSQAAWVRELVAQVDGRWRGERTVVAEQPHVCSYATLAAEPARGDEAGACTATVLVRPMPPHIAANVRRRRALVDAALERLCELWSQATGQACGALVRSTLAEVLIRAGVHGLAPTVLPPGAELAGGFSIAISGAEDVAPIACSLFRVPGGEPLGLARFDVEVQPC